MKAAWRAWFGVGLLGVVTSLACGRHSNDDPPSRTEPWRPAPSTSGSAARPADDVELLVGPGSRVHFRTAGKTPKTGSIGVVRGGLTVALSEPERTRGTLEADLTTLVVEDGNGSIDDAASLEARRWIGVGEQLPDVERNARRWARFAVKAATIKARRRQRRSGGAAGGASTAPPGERWVLTLSGELTVNAVRVEREVNVELALAADGLRAHLETQGGLALGPREHHVQPRDALGRLLAAELTRASDVLGKLVRVEAELELASPKR